MVFLYSWAGSFSTEDVIFRKPITNNKIRLLKRVSFIQRSSTPPESISFLFHLLFQEKNNQLNTNFLRIFPAVLSHCLHRLTCSHKIGQPPLGVFLLKWKYETAYSITCFPKYKWIKQRNLLVDFTRRSMNCWEWVLSIN